MIENRGEWKREIVKGKKVASFLSIYFSLIRFNKIRIIKYFEKDLYYIFISLIILFNEIKGCNMIMINKDDDMKYDKNFNE